MTEFGVAYDDDSLLVVDKPQGLPTAGGKSESLCDLVFARRPELAAVEGFRRGEGGLLNRLDNDTGGLVLFAKTTEAFSFYAKAMKGGWVVKEYLAVVHGVPGTGGGEIAFPIGHSAKSKRRMLVADGRRGVRGQARAALTSWRLLTSRPPYSLLAVTIAKGLRHQIRVHLAASGLPIVGDKLYNTKGSADAVNHHLLYCRLVRFPTPDGKTRNAATVVPFQEAWNA
ncbi:MAG: RNA pseudouridine synthase [Spirochaetales bacterium]|nr:RNA pseudouridine synthase [Spirochaetales bacterium]